MMERKDDNEGRYKNMMKKGLAVIMAAAILCQGVFAEETL